MKRLWLALVVLVMAAAPAHADVTMTMSISLNAGPIAASGQNTTFQKGTKVRIDSKIMKQDQSILIDLDTKQAMMLDNVAKQVRPFDPKQAMAGLPVTFGEASASVKPTGQTKEIMGRVCQGFAFEVAIPMTMNGETLTVKASGPAWLAKDDSVMAQYQAAQKALTDAGLSLSPLGQGPQAKGMAEVAKALAGAGIVMEQEIHMTMEGTGQMAQMMGQMGNIAMTMTVTAISTDPIPDEKFQVPAGYTKK
jgi:hypothetical protein